MPQCITCGRELKLIPAGVSKSTGRPYDSFYACEDRNHKQPKPTPAQAPVQKFEASLDQMTQDKKWEEISKGKVRYGFALETYKMGKKLDVTTATEIKAWTEFVMSGKLARTEEQEVEDFANSINF